MVTHPEARHVKRKPNTPQWAGSLTLRLRRSVQQFPLVDLFFLYVLTFFIYRECVFFFSVMFCRILGPP